MNKKNRLKLVASDGASRGSARKQRRLAATIAAPEPNRPRLPEQADTAEALASAAWQKRWAGIRPVAETVPIYVAGCTGTMALGGVLGMPTYKVGTATDVPARMQKLKEQRYGSLVIQDFAIRDERGWDDWVPAKLSTRPTHPASPVRVLPRGLLVELPFWISVADFEALLVAALEHITLASIAASPEGRALVLSRGCGIDDLLRYSRSAHGPVLATEICVIAPSGDASRLVRLIESIIVSLVLADDGWEG